MNADTIFNYYRIVDSVYQNVCDINHGDCKTCPLFFLDACTLGVASRKLNEAANATARVEADKEYNDAETDKENN